MKKIKYRKYDILGNYDNKEISVPDSCGIYEIPYTFISRQVKDKDTCTKDYILISPEEFIGGTHRGNIYTNIIDDIYITDSELPILNIEAAPKLNDLYLVKYNEYEQIKSISKFKRFAPGGIEIATVITERIDKNISSIVISEMSYFAFYVEKFIYSPEIAKMFQEKVEKVYKSAIYE